jgi:predicted GIY-YIG superfamily endonuclease
MARCLDGVLRLHRRQPAQRYDLRWHDRRFGPPNLAHRTKAFGGFTAKHGCDQLVWFEVHESRLTAFTRERRIKNWRRSWKLMLIEEANPTWADLYETLNT